MEWNLRLAAARRGIWTATDLRTRLAAHGLAVSAGKMSKWWSGRPASVKLDDLDALCAVLGCPVDELLIPEQTSRPRLTPVPAPARRAR
ncbi:helix-turn-helix transcriptional regulator [Amycolatopsis sp. FU40]|uniref:helix-turn-helix domain-containing protein n=1 Tax=Amycolatopsis sp. FU40 TaxID=2914159 RepID=UPI001F3911F7|nr:helix-turn-helix transcriptional regulator [Amycolatopsis sp. FU40]UKD59418.1 helix-turn-helix transcriptional regulator [Amycolatopsis sp. FU40]